jgi:hypothetical protein
MTTTRSQQDSFTDGVGKFAEAARHSVTASRLAAAGTMAVGAATYFYFADPERREAAVQSATRMFEDLTSWWRGPPADRSDAGTAEPPAGSGATETRPAPGTAA